jgi:hypothetical protein
MKRFAVLVILGPCLVGMTTMLLVLPLATWLEGGGGWKRPCRPTRF